MSMQFFTHNTELVIFHFGQISNLSLLLGFHITYTQFDKFKTPTRSDLFCSRYAFVEVS